MRVIGMKDKDNESVWMITDSNIQFDESFFRLNDLSCENNHSIFKFKNKVLLGVSSKLKILNALNTADDIIPDLLLDNLSYKLIIKHVVPKIRDILSDFNCVDDNGNISNGAIILAHENDLWIINKDFSVMECSEFCSTITPIAVNISMSVVNEMHGKDYPTSKILLESMVNLMETEKNINYPLMLKNSVSEDVIIIANETEFNQYIEKV